MKLESLKRKYILKLERQNFFIIYDPPHSLKSIIKNLLKYNFQCEEHLAKWSDIAKFSHKEDKEVLRLAPNLPESTSI